MATMVPIKSVLPNPEQPRRYFDPREIRGLAQSIEVHGVIQPISVYRTQDKYVLIDGERRLRACKAAGLTEIPADIREDTPDAQALLERALVANIQRTSLNPLEEGETFRRLHVEHGLSFNQIAARVGISQATVTQRLMLLELEQPIKDLVARGVLHQDRKLLKALLAIPNSEARIRTAESLSGKGIRLSAAIDVCLRVAQEIRAQAPPKPEPEPEPAISASPPDRHRKIRQVQATTAPLAPALKLARRRAKMDDEPLPLKEWNMLYQIDRVPPWPAVAESAMETCDACGFRNIASYETCRQCPAVELLERMLKAVKTHREAKRVGPYVGGRA